SFPKIVAQIRQSEKFTAMTQRAQRRISRGRTRKNAKRKSLYPVNPVNQVAKPALNFPCVLCVLVVKNSCKKIKFAVPFFKRIAIIDGTSI
ncbi:MAG TPA: hypothetical protein VGB00_05370, partial [Pyrinomonadaceae bacterium]